MSPCRRLRDFAQDVEKKYVFLLNKGCVWQCSGCGRQARPSSLTLGSNPHSKKLEAPCPARNRLNFHRAAPPAEQLQPDTHVSTPPRPQGQGGAFGPLRRFPKAPPSKDGSQTKPPSLQAHPLARSFAQSRSEDQGGHLAARSVVKASPISPVSSRPQGLGTVPPLVPKAKVEAKSATLETLRKSTPVGKASAKSSPGPSIKSFFAPKKGSGQ